MANIPHEMIESRHLNLPINYVIYDDGQARVVPPHWHEAVEINFTVQGENHDFLMNGQRFAAKAGEYIVVNASTVHEVATPPKNFRGLTLLLMPEFFTENGFDLATHLFFRAPLNHDVVLGQKMAAYLQQFYDAVTQDTVNQWQLKQAVFGIGDLLVHAFSYPSWQAQPLLVAPDERIHDMIRYIKMHSADLLTPSDLASKFNVSASYLARYFKQRLGMSPNQYLQFERLQLAQVYLANTDYAMSWIAHKSGFVSEKSFQRLFKKYYQMPPRDYRAMVQKSSQKMP